MPGAILRFALGRVALVVGTIFVLRLLVPPATCTAASPWGGLEGLRSTVDSLTRALDSAGRF